MLMTMMGIRKVRMFMGQRFVTMRMRMRLLPIPLELMSVVVMSIMHMSMMMFHQIVLMPVGMLFSQMQPHAHTHEESGCQKSACHWRAERHRQRRADKGSQGEVGTGSGCPQIAQCQHEKRQTQSITDKPQ